MHIKINKNNSKPLVKVFGKIPLDECFFFIQKIIPATANS